jgi:hypothetical protein
VPSNPKNIVENLPALRPAKGSIGLKSSLLQLELPLNGLGAGGCLSGAGLDGIDFASLPGD